MQSLNIVVELVKYVTHYKQYILLCYYNSNSPTLWIGVKINNVRLKQVSFRCLEMYFGGCFYFQNVTSVMGAFPIVSVSVNGQRESLVKSHKSWQQVPKTVSYFRSWCFPESMTVLLKYFYYRLIHPETQWSGTVQRTFCLFFQILM